MYLRTSYSLLVIFMVFISPFNSSKETFNAVRICGIIALEVIALYKDAIFIGKDGSCNLKHGQNYRIEIVENKSVSRFRFRFYVFIHGIGIPYDTMAAIKKNWQFSSFFTKNICNDIFFAIPLYHKTKQQSFYCTQYKLKTQMIIK